MRTFPFLAFCLAAIVSFAACSGDDGVDDPTPSATSAAAGTPLALGDTAELNNGVSVAVLSVQPAGQLAGREPAPGQELVFVRVRVENGDDETQASPDISLICSNGAGTSYAFDGAGGLDRSELEAGDEREGVRLFGKPANCADGLVEAKALGLSTGIQRLAGGGCPEPSARRCLPSWLYSSAEGWSPRRDGAEPVP